MPFRSSAGGRASRIPAAGRLAGAVLAALALLVHGDRARSLPGGPIVRVWVTNGDSRFAGDGRLLTTISPNGDGFRDRALVHLVLTSPARVRLEVAATRSRPAPVSIRTVRLGAGRHTLVWAPPPEIEPRTYEVLLSARDAQGRTVLYGARRPREQWSGDTPVVRVQGLDARLDRESYRAGETAALRVATDARAFSLQVFALGNELVRSSRGETMRGDPLTAPRAVDWRDRRGRPGLVRLTVGTWPTGFYYVELRDATGRVGYAPLIVRPDGIGEHRVAVILPTETWAAYNFEDANGNGWGDTWYAGWATNHATLGRHNEGWGLPYAFQRYDLPFLRWLLNRGRGVDYLTDGDLDRVAGARTLAAAYDLLVFEGHSEYVTARAYDLVERYRDLGGNIAYLTANNFFWKVARRGRTLSRVVQWRDVGRDEAGLVGVRYRAGNRRFGPYVARHVEAAPWLFEGSGIRNGDRFLTGGIEIDKMSARSPRGTVVLAAIPNLFGPGRTAQMTYYAKGGAKVFAAGAITLAGSAMTPVGGKLLDNLWAFMSRP